MRGSTKTSAEVLIGKKTRTTTPATTHVFHVHYANQLFVFVNYSLSPTCSLPTRSHTSPILTGEVHGQVTHPTEFLGLGHRQGANQETP